MDIDISDTKPFLITALPHSATKYAAMVFQAIGLDVLHESIGKHGSVGCDHAWRPRADFPEHLGIPDDAVILHQVRNPILVIESLAVEGAIDWMSWQPRLAQNHIDWSPLDEPAIIGCMRLWLLWNKVAETLASYTYQVENMEACFPVILKKLGLPPSAFPVVSKTTNQHMSEHRLTWSDLYKADAALCREIMGLAKRYGYAVDERLMKEPKYSEVAVAIGLGIGDVTFLEPGIRLLLQADTSISRIHLFARADANMLYHAYDKVKTYPLDAKSARLQLQAKGIPLIEIDSLTHPGNDIRNRIDAFTCKLLSLLGNYPGDYPAPELPVDEQYVEWAETYINKREGERVVIWQMEASKAYKSLPREKSKLLIAYLLEHDWKVLVITDIQDLPRHKNLKVLKAVSMERFMGLCCLADVVFAMDSAPAWIAASVGATTIAVFGPTSPFRYAIKSPNVHILQWDPNCGNQPCGGGCIDNRCMWQIPDDLILDAINNPEDVPTIIDALNFYRPYSYTPSKTPIIQKPIYSICVVIPHVFLGGGETQMEHLIDELLCNYQYEIKLVIEGTVDEFLYPRWAGKYDCVQLNGIDKAYVLHKMLEDEQPDIILYHGTSILAAALPGLLHKPICIQIAHTGHGPWTEGVMRQMRPYNDHVITVAAWLNAKFSVFYPDTRFTTVLNGVPYRDWKKPAVSSTFDNGIINTFTLGIMSRLVGGKGIDVLIDAMDGLPDAVRLIVAGWGDMEDHIRKRAAGRIESMGAVTEPDLFWDKIDCAILPSDAEGNSMFLLEAAMRGKPIIATNVGAVPELFLDNETVLAIEATVEDIQSAVLRFLQEPNLLAKMSRSAYESICVSASSYSMATGYNDVMMRELSHRQNPASIVCYRKDGMGDVLMTLYAIRYLQWKYPAAKITYLLPPALFPVLAELNVVDVVKCDSDEQWLLAAKESDAAIFFQHEEVWDTGEHIITHYLKMAGCSDIQSAMNSLIDVGHIILPETYQNLPAYVCIHRRSAFGCKNWGTDAQWRRIVKFLQCQGLDVIVVGGDEGLTPAQTMRLLRDAKLFIGVDSFPLHGATAVGCPVIGIYAGANPPTLAAYSQNINVVSPMDCSCDGSKRHDIACLYNYACLEYISSQDIINAVKQTFDLRL